MTNKKHKDKAKPFKWKHAVGEIILWPVAWYCRYALSYRDLKEMAAERGFTLDPSTIYRGVQEYAPELNKRIKRYLKSTCDSWKLDETYLKITSGSLRSLNISAIVSPKCARLARLVLLLWYALRLGSATMTLRHEAFPATPVNA